MQRKRDGLVPIAEAFSDLGGPVKAIRDASPQGQRHFTQADQVNQLVMASEADPDLGFMGANDGAVLPAPHQPRQPPSVPAHQRPLQTRDDRGGGQETALRQPAALAAGLDFNRGRAHSIPHVGFGGFTLGVHAGAWDLQHQRQGTHTRLRNQMRRLFNAHVQLVYADEQGEARVSSSVADRTEFWWNERKPEEPTLWESKIYLGEEFFNEIINHPVPLDMNTLTALKRCSLGLDLYLWLTYRTFTLRAPQRLSWRQVYRQFGPNPNNAATNNAIQNFRRRILRELKKIKLAWPGLNYSTAPGLLILHPSTPAIAPLNQGQLGS